MPSPLVQPKQRIHSVDILRGIIMIIMALDHCRDFFHIHAFDSDPTDMATTTPIYFFTRWITHYCAPNFLFLSGMSAFLAGLKKTKQEQSIWLIKRGIWLLFVEVFIMTLAFTFNPLYNVIILQVIWSIGWSMIILGLLIRTNIKVIAVVGVIIFFGHNLLDYVKFDNTTVGGFLLDFFVTASHKFIPYAPNRFILVFYAAVPWTGCMLLGYAMAQCFKPAFDAAKRRRIFLSTGIAFTVLFIVLRLMNAYGDPSPWSTQRSPVITLLSFFNVTKYPPSLMYCCMTIGPGLVVLSLLENVQNKLTDIFEVYGRVPFAYYIMHFYLIHTITVIMFFVQGFGAKDIIDPNVPFLFRPTHLGVSLAGVYLLWCMVVAILYLPCKRFYQYKLTHKQWWLSYL
jgi:uncharacterized membrane protein